MQPPPQRSRPPRWADRLVKIFCPIELQEELLGDLHEQFEQLVTKRGDPSDAYSKDKLSTLKSD